LLALLVQQYKYWYNSTNTDTQLRAIYTKSRGMYSVCLLYWYNSTNTDTQLSTLWCGSSLS